MICVHVVMRHPGEAFKRVPVRVALATGECLETRTDRVAGLLRTKGEH
ncbi:MAG: hypothetical protein H6926_07250 [Chromatiales bacterium]|nr:hypothetical protein [Gammaproteobacteria bacterium]MCP5352967.1 hypothetical protein [Chromatiales bacterium]